LRFEESNLDETDAFGDCEDLHYEGPADEPPVTVTPRPAPRKHECHILHLIITEQAPLLPLRLFKIYELPEGLIERTLGSPADRVAVKAIRSGFTCRAVRTEGKRGSHVFNGRIGESLPAITQAEEADFLNLVTFPVMKGNSGVEEQEPTASSTKYWKFKDGEEVGVKQWLAGMGQTELVEPEQQPDLPKDAKKMLAPDRNPASGRIRMPKGASFLPDDSDDEDRSTLRGTSDAAPKAGFQQLLRRQADGDSESESDTASQSSSGSDDTAAGGKATFKSLLQPKQENKPHMQLPAPSRPVMPVNENSPARIPQASALPLRQISSGPRSQSGSAETGSESASAADSKFVSYGKQFAITDKVGLTANAASQARWEADNYKRAPRAPKGKIHVRSITPLSQRTTSGSSAPMSLSTGPEGQRMQPHPTPPSVDSISQATIRTHADALPGAELWENRIVQKRLPGGKLIDDTASAKTASTPKYPPGLGPPPGLAQPYPAYSVASKGTKKQADGSLSQNLVDVTDVPSANHQPMVKPPPGLASRVPMVAASPVHDSSTGGNDQIVERLQPQPEQLVVSKRYTMRQKAQKKGKGGNKHKVELPLPDPVPPPKKTKVVAQTPPEASSMHCSVEGTEMTEHGRADLPLPDPVPPLKKAETVTRAPPVPDSSQRSSARTELTERLHAAEALVQMSPERMPPDTHVDVHIGQTLLSMDDKSVRKAVLSAVALASKLNSAASPTIMFFNDRLTTSAGDARHLTSLAEGPLTTKALYEFHIRDANGSIRMIRAGMLDPDSHAPATEIHSIVHKKYCIHYPIRVWDAMLIKHTSAKPGVAFTQFFVTLTTLRDPPAFTAIVPKDDFTVEKVFTRKEYASKLGNDSTGSLVVTEVQELFLRTLNASRTNLEATCLPREEMIAQQRL